MQHAWRTPSPATSPAAVPCLPESQNIRKFKLFGCLVSECPGLGAYHPFSSFGNVPPAALINGIAGFEGWARVAAGRLLQGEGEGEGVLDICAESWTEAAPKVAEIYAKVSETGEPDVVTARAQAMKARRPEGARKYMQKQFS